MATGTITPTAEQCCDVTGSLTSGTFTDNEVVTQLVTLKTGRFIAQNTGHLVLYECQDGADGAHSWVGQTSAAIWAPSAAPVTMFTYGLTATQGFTTGATYNYALDADNRATASTPKLNLVSKSNGLSPTTIAVTAYLTHTRRKPGTAIGGSYTKDEFTSGGSLYTRHGLSTAVYKRDNTGGGNSGTAPTMDAPTNFITNTGGASEQSIVLSAAACTNNSSLAYRKGFGQWDLTPDFMRVDADFRLGFDVEHPTDGGYDGVAAVELSAVGQTSSHSDLAVLTDRPAVALARVTTVKDETGSLIPVCNDAYSRTVAIAGFTVGEQIKIRARVGFNRGDTIFDTNDNAADYMVQHRNTLTYYYVAAVYGICDPAGGNDGTGVASATIGTARASAYATINAAFGGGANKVYVKNQTAVLPATGRSDLGYWYEIEADPTSLGGVVTIPTGFYYPGPPKLRIKNLIVRLLGTTSIFTTNTQYVFLDGCTGDPNGFTLAGPLFDGIAGAIMQNCLGFDRTHFSFDRSGADFVRQSFDGVAFGSASGFIKAWFKMVACTGSGVVPTGEHATGIAFGRKIGRFFKNCEFLSIPGKCEFSTAAADYDEDDCAFVGLVLEFINLGSAEGLSFAEGASPEYHRDGVGKGHLTILGARENEDYNDGPDDASANDDPKYRRWYGQSGVVRANQEIKSDGFVNATTGRKATRLGNHWPYLGMDASDGWARLSDFPPDFRGLGSVQATTDPKFTDDRSGDTSGGDPYHYNANSGLGGGNYTLQATSPYLGRLNGPRHAKFDSRGRTIPATGGAGGACQSGAPAAPSGLTLGTATSTTQPLTWTDNSSNETSFDVRYYVTSAGVGTATTVTGIAANATSYTVTGLTANTDYTYQVRATNAAGSSAWSTSAHGKTAAASVFGGRRHRRGR